MGPAPMVTLTTTRRSGRRSGGCAALAAALACAGAFLPVPPARAADPITAADQSYFAYYHLDQARAKGYTGKGVSIAMIDGKVDTGVPELAGAQVASESPCTINSSPAVSSHGTGVASILVAQGYGVAPEASLRAYQITLGGDGDTSGSDCKGESGDDRDNLPWLLNRAMNDGAQIINVSASSISSAKALKWTVARSMAQGVSITAAAGNEAQDDDDTSLSKWSGVVGVSAIGVDSARQDYSSWGQGVTAAAVGGPVLTRNIATEQIEPVYGTSYSAPVVAGVLALARQKWPNATSNQLLQLLVTTGLNPDHGWNQYTGYGGIDPGAILNTDPTQLPDENPLADKGGGSSPTPAEVRQYADGLVSPTEIVNDNSYTYRGIDETTLKNPANGYPTHIGTSPSYHAK